MQKDQFTNDFSKEVWETTYKANSDTSLTDTFYRVAKAIALAEHLDKQEIWTENFYSVLSDFYFTSGGRIYSNAGSEWGGTTLMNCYVSPRGDYDIDSLDGILENLRQQAQTLKSEGGWGNNFSFIRPRSAFIYGVGVESPGSVKYMELFDKSSDVITSGSGVASKNEKAKKKIRKGAMMAILDVWHPDIEEFIVAKQTPGRLTKFNMSVNASDAFMDRVLKIEKIESAMVDSKEDFERLSIELALADSWNLVFPETRHSAYKAEWDGNIDSWIQKGYPVNVHKTISVKYLWNLITESTFARNEPGVLFLDVANRTHCWNYGKYSYIGATNPCAEQCMPYGTACNLGSANLTQFVDPITRRFNLEKFKNYVRIAVRFLDNVNDCTNVPLPEYELSIKNRRRIGLGIMGWASALFMMRVRFGSEEAAKIKQELMEAFVYTAVEASIDLAEEKGMFPDCEPEKHAEVEFWNQVNLPEYLRDRIRKFGMRNSSLFSFQPNGNTSIFANMVSGGMEPIFLWEYIRTSIVSTVPSHLELVTPKFWQGEFTETEFFKFAKEGDEIILRGVDEFGVVYKIDKNRGLTKETLCQDYGVSFLKQHGEWDEKADWAVTTATLTTEEHIKDMVEWAKWIDSSMSKTVNLPNDYTFKDFKNIYLDAYKSKVLKGITTYRAGTMTSVLSSVDSKSEKNNKIKKNQATKRPKELECDVRHFTVKGHRYYTLIGVIDGEPYEVFAGSNHDGNGDIIIPKSVEKGKLVKKGKGNYVLVTKEKTFENVNSHADENVDALTRLISCSLRHGSDVSFIVLQLEKTEGGMMSFAKIIGRTLKKYIPDGTEVHGEVCPECGKPLVRREGCQSCSNCSWSKCS